MLSVKNRLPRSEIVKKFDKNVTDTDLRLFFRPNNLGRLRAAVIISKSIAKKAVDRNRVKRILTESLKEYLKLGLDVKIMVRNNIADLNQKVVKQKLNALLGKIK